MAKLKTHRGAAKRFKLRKSGKIKFAHAKRRHMMTNKTHKRNRQAKPTGNVATPDEKHVVAMLRGQ